MEVTGTIKKTGHNKQVLDKLQVEKERGITVKAQTVSLKYMRQNQAYLLNLIDTPGHIDFNYEVSRSMSACQGAILLVDASQGIQAQTIVNYNLAIEQGLTIIPVLNKVDLPHADVSRVSQELEDNFGMDISNLIGISAKSGLNVDQVLEAIIDLIPSPTASSSDCTNQSKILLFDSWFDKYRGVISLIAVKEGIVRSGHNLVSLHSQKKHPVIEVGLMHPEEPIPVNELAEGQVGYMITASMKKPTDALIGDTLFVEGSKTPKCIEGFKKPSPMIFASVFPVSNSEFLNLNDAIEKLTLNDSSVQVARTNSSTLGLGFRCGFLGMLHLDVFRQRLEQEHGLAVILTSPSVSYKFHPKNGNQPVIIDNPSEFPEHLFQIDRIDEPLVPANIITPELFLGDIIKLCDKRRGKQHNMEFLGDRIVLGYKIPMAEIVENHFFNELKQISSGHASLSLSTEEIEYSKSDIVKMDVRLNGNIVDALTCMTHRSVAVEKGRKLAAKLKNLMDRQLFEISIQVMVNNKSVAKETLKPLRKDVTAKLYGGDQTRKMKLLDKQKEGKKKMKMIGKVEISPETFLSLVQNK